MKIYLVGGAVRDWIRGVTPNDFDYVVVGSTPEEMINLGYTQVGADFPVFLHPVTKDEYALARTERKAGEGYNGFICDFTPDVTIEQDLLRRDLTINAIAYDQQSRQLIDPFGGVDAIKNKQLKHVSDAFGEDPVRVLRLARFQAELGEEWTVDQLTRDYCTELYQAGAFQHLTSERVWKETHKAFCSNKPSLFFNFLNGYNIFRDYEEQADYNQRPDYHPEVNCQLHTDMVMDYAAKNYSDPEITFAAYCHDLGKPTACKARGVFHGHEVLGVPIVAQECSRLKVPRSYSYLAYISTLHHTKIHGALEMRPSMIMKLFKATCAIRNPDRFIKFLKVCSADSHGRGYPRCSEPYPQYDFIVACLNAVLAVNVKQISRESIAKGRKGQVIGEDIHLACLNAVKRIKEGWSAVEND